MGPLLILLVAALAVAPELLHGPSCGHDFDFHLTSWLDVQNSWRQWVFYPHWSPSAAFGAGEPRFVFYPPLTWMLGAALGLLLPWTLVPVALTWMLLALTGLATRALARQALSDTSATLAGCFALFSGYSLFTAYERTAFGELAGGFWIPLLLLYALRNRRAETANFQPQSFADQLAQAVAHENRLTLRSTLLCALDGSALPLSLIMAGAWLSNAPLGVMASYLLAFVAVVSAVHARSWAPLLRASVAVVLGLALSSFYLLPAAYQQRWVNITQATDDPGMKIENSFLFAHHADAALALHDMELQRVSWIAVTMLTLALLGLLLGAWKGKFEAQRRWWLPLALLPLMILFLLLPISLPLWNLLPKLRFLQFPWRWLVVLEAPMGIFLAAAIWPIWRRMQIILASGCAICFLAATVFSAHSFFQVCDEEDSVPGMLSAYHGGFAGVDEYVPLGADGALTASNLPDACLVNDPMTVLGVPTGTPDEPLPAWTPAQGSCEKTFAPVRDSFYPRTEHFFFEADIPRSSYMVLRLRTYPAWQIKVNGKTVSNLPRREDGLTVVPVPQGKVELTVDWTTTPDVRLSRWLTVLAVFLLTGLSFVEQKLRHCHLS